MKRILSLLLALALIPGLAIAQEALSARRVYDLLEAGDAASVYALFDGTMKSALKEEDLSSLLPAIQSSLGNFTGFGEEETTLSAPYRITALPVYYENGGILLQITWQEDRIAGLHYSLLPPRDTQAKALPQGVTEEEISVGDPALPGVLTLPAVPSSPLPAVVLLHGSGPNDRDETIGQTKLFRDLAWGLAQRGIAVLRFDKRTYVYGSAYTREEMLRFTAKEESILDAMAAARLLQNDPRIDPGRIFLIGHSLGAMLSPRIAEEYPDLFAGIVLLSGTPKTLAEIVISQNRAAAEQLPLISRAIGLTQVSAMEKNWATLQSGSAESALQQTVFGQPAYYFWEMAQHDTGSILRSLSIPVLIINGGQDFQVTNADGVDAWQALALQDTVKTIYHPDLNHLLMRPNAPEGVKGTAQEYEIPCCAAEEVLSEIAQFILQ